MRIKLKCLLDSQHDACLPPSEPEGMPDQHEDQQGGITFNFNAQERLQNQLNVTIKLIYGSTNVAYKPEPILQYRLQKKKGNNTWKNMRGSGNGTRHKRTGVRKVTHKVLINTQRVPEILLRGSTGSSVSYGYLVNVALEGFGDEEGRRRL